jgi:hypothetical protein
LQFFSFHTLLASMLLNSIYSHPTVNQD